MLDNLQYTALMILGLEANPEKTEYMLRSRCQKTGQADTKTANRSCEDTVKLRNLKTTLTDQKCMHEEIKSRLNSGNACYHSVQSILSSRLLSRNVKVKIYKTIILSVVLYGCETWSIALREENRYKSNINWSFYFAILLFLLCWSNAYACLLLISPEHHDAC
jgi:hypothetical protein